MRAINFVRVARPGAARHAWIASTCGTDSVKIGKPCGIKPIRTLMPDVIQLNGFEKHAEPVR